MIGLKCSYPDLLLVKTIHRRLNVGMWGGGREGGEIRTINVPDFLLNPATSCLVSCPILYAVWQPVKNFPSLMSIVKGCKYVIQIGICRSPKLWIQSWNVWILWDEPQRLIFVYFIPFRGQSWVLKQQSLHLTISFTFHYLSTFWSFYPIFQINRIYKHSRIL